MPSRVDFMVDIYGIDRNRCELLFMGAEDEYVESARRPEKRSEIRERFGIKPDEFLVMTGGKIDAINQHLPSVEAFITIIIEASVFFVPDELVLKCHLIVSIDAVGIA